MSLITVFAFRKVYPIAQIEAALAVELVKANDAKFVNRNKAIRLTGELPGLDSRQTLWNRIEAIASIKNNVALIPLCGGLTRTEHKPEVLFKSPEGRRCNQKKAESR